MVILVKKKLIAVIPARGGSTRIPKKNIVEFCGKPLIIWTIEAAVKSNIFDRILVSTDDPEIASVVEKYGLEIPFLREKHSDNFSPVSQATISALDQVKEKFGEEYETVIQLLPTCPLRSSKHIIEAYNNFLEKKSLFQINCSQFGLMNPWWVVKLDEKSHPQPIFPEALKERSQDLEPLYCPTGAIWIADVNALKSKGTFYGEGLTFYLMEWKAAIDIDTVEDIELAKAVFELVNENGE
ncbi:cytidylyltransferase domain-containing protein [Nanoarchaeota archaeon]